MDYNSDGEIASIWGTKGTQNSLYANAISYNSAGAMERLKLGNGKWETAKYNERLQVTEIGLGNSATDKSLLKLEFGYGTATQNNGSMRSQKISFNGLSQAFEQVYAYDDLNRLQSAEEKINANTNWKQTFQYDRFGNRRFDAANTTNLSQSSPNKVTNPLINTSDNRLKKDQDNDLVNDYDYDKNGNLTQDSEGKTFLYDAENHQKELKINGVSKGKYLYDGDGKRVKKISDLETTIFVYNGAGQLVAEYSTQQATTPQVSYLTSDHLGSPRIITDNTGNIIARKDFNAFGDETNSAQRTTTLGYKPEEIRQDYTGYQKDDESGLEFAQARYYNNKHGRFTSVDPLTASANVKDPQTFNRYSYAMNSPYKFTDPLGLISQSSGGSGFCGAENSSCGDGEGEELSTQSIDDYQAAQAETETPATQATSTVTAQVAQESAEGPPTPTAEQNADGNSLTLEESSVDNNIPGDEDVGIEVIVWDDIWTPSASWYGHVSYVIDGVSYSFDREGYHAQENPSDYIDKRRETSGATGFGLDFGSLELNNKFKDLIKGAYKDSKGKTESWGPLNNCGYAFKAAINAIAEQIGVKTDSAIKPKAHRQYIQNNLETYRVRTNTYTYIKGNSTLK